MSLDNVGCIDAIGIENESGNAVLTIADSWVWSDVESHLSALRAKLNAYFEFIDTGQIWEDYPAANGRALVIDVVTRYPLPIAGHQLLEQMSDLAQQRGVIIRHCHFPGTDFEGTPPD